MESRLRWGLANIAIAIQDFFKDFGVLMFQRKEFELSDLDAEMVYDSFRRTAQSVGAMNGWQPKELSYFSLKICGHIAVMLNQIEAGSPWPTSTRHARVVYLEKAEAAVGEVMSYRPLTITAPLYRAWATMRLKGMEEWIATWALPEMHAGVPEMGAVDAWHKALTDIEEMKLNGTPFCGGVADIAKFFDQIRRQVVYKMAKYAGMPTKVLDAYTAYLENLLLATA